MPPLGGLRAWRVFVLPDPCGYFGPTDADRAPDVGAAEQGQPHILRDAHLAPCQSHKAGIHQLIDQRRLFGRQSFSQQLVRRAYAHTAIANKKYTGSGGRKEGCTAEELSGIVVDYASSKLGSRGAFWSNVSVRVHPARPPSSAISASANDPRPCFSATMAVKTSCSFSIARTSTCSRRSTAVAISRALRP